MVISIFVKYSPNNQFLIITDDSLIVLDENLQDILWRPYGMGKKQVINNGLLFKLSSEGNLIIYE